MIHLRSFSPASRRTVYRIAGERVTMDVRPAILMPFAISEKPDPAPALDPSGWTFERILDSGGREIGSGREEVLCAVGERGYRLALGRCGDFVVTRGGLAQCVRPGETPDRVLEAMLGPVLILALALRGIYCLHASACRRAGEDGVHVFLGPSGVGKSTLAAFLASHGWERIADDVTALTPTGVRGGFPQLKLRPDEQPAGAEELPLRGIHILRRGEKASARPSGPGEAVLALAGRTLATRCFAPELLAEHLVFCRDLAAGGCVDELEVPQGVERLGEVEAALQSSAKMSSASVAVTALRSHR